MPKLAPIASTSADRNASTILELIAEYQRCARAAISGLKKQSRANDLLTSRKLGKINRTGKLLVPKGRYTFHGAGCRFEIDRRVIDVDFGPSGRHDGFDAWRLHQFSESSFEWQHLHIEEIEAGLKKLCADEIVSNPSLEPSPHLLYLTEDLEPRARQLQRRAVRSRK